VKTAHLAGAKKIGSADWILLRLERFPISRVHAAYLETKGQPFYGWFVDGSDDKIQARFQRAFLQAPAAKSNGEAEWVELGPGSPLKRAARTSADLLPTSRITAGLN